MLKEGDFIEIDYTGKVKGDEMVFDTTLADVAKEQGMDERKYEPAVICLGQGNILPGLDKKLIGKETGKSYTINLTPEESFGKKDASLIQLINTSKFRKDNVEPMPGMQVNVDGNIGIVRTVTGGRTMVDFNHPLSSKDVVYEVNIKRLITDDLEKAKNYLKMFSGDSEMTLADGKLIVKMKRMLPDEITKMLADRVKTAIPTIKEVVFEGDVLDEEKEEPAKPAPESEEE